MRAAGVALPVVLALLLCLVDLGGRSLWLDEGASIAIASQHGGALSQALARDGGNMLIFYLGLHVLIASCGDAISLLRLPSALFAALTAGLVAWTARRLLGARAALPAGLLSAASLSLVYWGQNIRGYAAMIMFVAASYAALVWLAGPPAEGARPWRGMLYALVTALGVYCSFAAALVIPAQALWVAWDPRRRRAVLPWMALALLLCVPLVPLAAARGTGQLFWVGKPTLRDVGHAGSWLTSAGLPPDFALSAVGKALLYLSLAMLAGLLAALIIPRVRRAAAAEERWREAARLAVLWLTIPFLLDLVESLAGQPVLLPRNSLVSLPAMALALSCVLRHPRVPVAGALVLLAALLGLRLAVLIPAYGTSPENWREAVRAVSSGTRAGDCILIYPQDGRMPIDEYVRVDHLQMPRPELPKLAWSHVHPYVESYYAPVLHELSLRLSGCRRTWLLSSHAGQATGPPASRLHLRRLKRLRNELRAFYAVCRRRKIGYAAVIEVSLCSQPKPGGATAAAPSPRR